MNFNVFGWFFSLFSEENDNKTTLIGLTQLKSAKGTITAPIKSTKKNPHDIKISDLMKGIE